MLPADEINYANRLCNPAHYKKKPGKEVSDGVVIVKQLEGSGWKCYIAKSDSHIWVVPGATENSFGSHLTNIRVRFAQHRSSLLHEGASRAAEEIIPEIPLDPTRPLRLAGHSQGGAIALCISAMVDNDYLRAARVFTFGAYRVFAGPKSAENWEHRMKLLYAKHATLAHCKDVVPLYPLNYVETPGERYVLRNMVLRSRQLTLPDSPTRCCNWCRRKEIPYHSLKYYRVK